MALQAGLNLRSVALMQIPSSWDGKIKWRLCVPLICICCQGLQNIFVYCKPSKFNAHVHVLHMQVLASCQSPSAHLTPCMVGTYMIVSLHTCCSGPSQTQHFDLEPIGAQVKQTSCRASTWQGMLGSCTACWEMALRQGMLRQMICGG